MNPSNKKPVFFLIRTTEKFANQVKEDNAESGKSDGRMPRRKGFARNVLFGRLFVVFGNFIDFYQIFIFYFVLSFKLKTEAVHFSAIMSN